MHVLYRLCLKPCAETQRLKHTYGIAYTAHAAYTPIYSIPFVTSSRISWGLTKPLTNAQNKQGPSSKACDQHPTIFLHASRHVAISPSHSTSLQENHHLASQQPSCILPMSCSSHNSNKSRLCPHPTLLAVCACASAAAAQHTWGFQATSRW
jgi:hypothetical protein